MADPVRFPVCGVNSLSPCAKDLLGKWQGKYTLVHQAGHLFAQGMLLEDGSGRVQVISPSDALIDLVSLNQELKRNLRAVPCAQQEALKKELQLDTFSALPMVLGIQTVIDTRLLMDETVYLDSGCHDLLVKTQVEFLEQFADDMTVFGNFAVAVPNAKKNTLTSVQTQNLGEQFTSRRIRGRLDDTMELPPLPATAQGLLHLLSNPDSNIEELVRVVEVDPSLAAQVISWAQSPYYATPGKVTSIHDAITRVLGYDMVLNLALGLALSKTLKLPKEGVNGALSFWEQSVYTAALMEGLVRAMPARFRPQIGIAYLTGLLHNFGYLLLAEIFPPHFTSFCRYMEVNTHLNHYEVEQFLLQTDREEMGSWLMQVWGLSDELSMAVRFHNQPDYVGVGACLSKLLFVATRLLRRYQMTNIVSGDIPENILCELHLTAQSVEDIGETVFGKQEQLEKIVHQLVHH